MSKSFVSSSVTAGTVENTLQATPMLSETQHLRPQVPTNYNSSCYNDDDDEIDDEVDDGDERRDDDDKRSEAGEVSVQSTR